MKPKRVLLASIFLNPILEGWIMLLLCTPTRQPTGAPTATVSPGSATSDAQQRGAAKATLRPADASRIAPFDWRQVESGDYRQYIANLRAIGCPEKTIKDIVVADVNDLFSSRRASVTRTHQWLYWKEGIPLKLSDEQQKQLRDLYAQKWELLKALGVDTPDFTDSPTEARLSYEEMFDLVFQILPPSKQEQAKRLAFQLTQQAATEGNSVEQLGAIEQQTLARLQALLTAEEFKEYELRCSTDASNLRGVLDPLALTEQEFR